MGLVANGAQLDVERNYSYEFTITSVDGYGYATVADAKKSIASNTSLNYQVLIQDNSGYEIQANNDYYLGVTTRITSSMHRKTIRPNMWHLRW